MEYFIAGAMVHAVAGVVSITEETYGPIANENLRTLTSEVDVSTDRENLCETQNAATRERHYDSSG